jgi:diguanylate cyclase (GGDEF)-like protein
MKVETTTSKTETYPVHVESPDYFEGPRHKKVVLALAQEALHHSNTDHLHEEARTDHLTQLQNRRAFDESLAEKLASQDSDNTVAVMFVDLDKFKIVNDRMGHKTGDRALVDTADVLARVLSVREGEQAFRIGGDEFALLVNAKNIENGIRDKSLTPTEILDGLSKRIEEEVNLISRVIDVPEFGASVGYALFQPGDTAESMVGRADLAMYENKAAK